VNFSAAGGVDPWPPQQTAVPSKVSAQVWLSPALSATNVWSVGALIWPNASLPQQMAAPSWVSPQEWSFPLLIVLSGKKPIGIACPESLLPQQAGVPSGMTAQV
jgi:hypothetical protein